MSMHAIIECTLYRPGGTEVDLYGDHYHFRPSPEFDDRHVARVWKPEAIQRFLEIKEAYRLVEMRADPQPVAAAPANVLAHAGVMPAEPPAAVPEPQPEPAEAPQAPEPEPEPVAPRAAPPGADMDLEWEVPERVDRFDPPRPSEINEEIDIPILRDCYRAYVAAEPKKTMRRSALVSAILKATEA